MREVLVIGGTHGEEMPGINLVGSIQDEEITGIHGILGNPSAVKTGLRFCDDNLALSYPGRWNDRSYERHLANINLRLCYGYDLVVDVHSSEAPGDHYALVGERTSNLALQAIAFMGIQRILVTRKSTSQTLYTYMPNSFGVELSPDSRLRDLEHMRRILGELVTQPLSEQIPEFEVYADLEGGAITEEMAQELDLPASLPQLAQFSDLDVIKLGLTPNVPLFAQDWHSDAGIYRGVLATRYDLSLLLQNLRSVEDCYDEDYLDMDEIYFGSQGGVITSTVTIPQL
jgi:Succinylglutamate desuccinylase / Aspartoacylase family